MSGLEPQRESYQRLNDEKLEEYDLFVAWCSIPPSGRTYYALEKRTQVPQRKLKYLFSKHDWERRALDFDIDSRNLRPNPANMDEEASRAAQIAAATLLIELGLSAIQVKDPSLISAKTAADIVKSGVEIQRKALGEADRILKFTGDDINNVNELVNEVLQLEQQTAEEAEIVEEDDSES